MVHHDHMYIVKLKLSDVHVLLYVYIFLVKINLYHWFKGVAILYHSVF